MKLRVFEAFAGYGSQSIALDLLSQSFPDFQFETVGISEIDISRRWNCCGPHWHSGTATTRPWRRTIS